MRRAASIDTLVREFGDCVAEQSKCIAKGDARKGNKYAKRYVAAFEKLRSFGDAGRDALADLMDDERADVSVMAAGFLLRHAEERASAVLRVHAEDPGIIGLGAQLALERWKDGTWCLDPAEDGVNEVSLVFALDVEDEWPPVCVECIRFELGSGGYRALAAPLFVKDLSVGDVISVEVDGAGSVRSWRHVHRSDHTTVWLLHLAANDQIDRALTRLRELGCNTVSLPQTGCYSVDVPGSVRIADVDAVISVLDEKAVGVAFPSMRHAVP